MTDHPWERSDPAWPVHETDVVWETPFFEAGYDVVERPDGEQGRFYWLEPGDAAAVVALTDDDELVFVEQYRPRFRARRLNLPGGLVESDEEPERTAIRELREETGFRAGRVTYLDTHTLSPWTRYVRHVYVARDLTAGDPDPDEAEVIEVSTVPVEAAIDRISERDGPVNNLAITALTLAREEGLL